MRSFFNKTVLSMSIAIFSMFFGAGNAIFPLILGMKAGSQFGWAFFGLLLTGIGGPLLGLLGGTLFRGHCVRFFGQSGRLVGTLLLGLTLLLLGPFAGIPRCVTVAYSALTPLLSGVSLWMFAPLATLLSLFLCYQKKYLLPILGYVLSPLLIICLLMIIGQSLLMPSVTPEQTMTAAHAFSAGFSTGYDTMDLIASIFFSAGIWTMIEANTKNPSSHFVFKTTLKAGLVGCLLLALIYLGLTHAAAVYASQLAGVPPSLIMTHLATLALGPTWGLVANIAIALACLTTIIGLVMTLSQILSEQVFKERISYHTFLIVQLLITALIAPIGFDGIMTLIHTPIVVAYPIIIALTLFNIARKLKHRQIPEQA